MKLSEMKAILERGEIRLSKSLGQNFLHDANQLERIITAAKLTTDDRVLEIGPGLGPLTELLLDRARQVLAIEKDARLVEILQGRFAGRPWQLLHDDALAFLRKNDRDWSDWKLVANLPYSVASPILVELAQAQRGPRCLVATLQLEVVRRLLAKTGEKDYGVLTLLVQLEYQPTQWFKIPAGCFFPEPEVESACIVLERRDGDALSQLERRRFVRIVKRGFSQRRKMLLKLLKADWPAATLTLAFERLGLSPAVRAEAVPREDFIALTRLLSSASGNE